MNFRVELLLSLQRALLGGVHATLRQVSGEIDAATEVVRLRFEHDGEPSPEVKESCTTAATEVVADFGVNWQLDEVHAVVNAPDSLSPLAWIAYRRWEPAPDTAELGLQ